MNYQGMLEVWKAGWPFGWIHCQHTIGPTPRIMKNLAAFRPGSLVFLTLGMPDFSTLAQEMDVIDPDAITTALKIARRTLASENRETLLQIYRELSTDAPYEFTEGQSSARRLRNTCLTYLSKLCEEETTQLCLEQFRAATCMTDSIASLSCLANLPGPARDEALTAFYERSRENNELLSINKWLSVQAMAAPTGMRL